MIVNKHNLNIAKYCAKEPGGRHLDKLKVTANATIATDGVMLFKVAAVQPEVKSQTAFVDPSQVVMLGMFAGDIPFLLDPANLTQAAHPEMGFDEACCLKEGPATLEFRVKRAQLRAILDAADEFNDANDSLWIRYFERQPGEGVVQFGGRNADGQKWEAAVTTLNAKSVRKAFDAS